MASSIASRSVGRRSVDFLQPAKRELACTSEHFCHQIVLAAEMLIERTLCHVRARRDVVERRLTKPCRQNSP